MARQDPLDTLEHLSPADALAILRTLARNDAELAARIAEIARARLRGVDLEEIACVLYEELTYLEVEDVWYGAGPTRHGYVEPQDVADEMIAGVLEPYLEDLKKYQRLGMNAEANQLCMGLLLGCYQFEYQGDTEFKDWAPDAMYAYSQTILETWKSGKPEQADMKAVQSFIAERLHNWVSHAG